jgi:hypothetical protein
MNIVFFSSEQLDSSAASSTHDLIKELSLRGHRFVIVDCILEEIKGRRSELGRNPVIRHTQPAEVREALLNADVICYQLSNKSHPLDGMLPYLQDYPGIAILSGDFLNTVEANRFSQDSISTMFNSIFSASDLIENLDSFEDRLRSEIKIKFQSDVTRHISDQLIEWFPSGIPSTVIDEIGGSINELFNRL